MTVLFSALQPVFQAPSGLPGEFRPPVECRPPPANPRRRLVWDELLSRAAEAFAAFLSRLAPCHSMTSKGEILAVPQEHTQSQAEVLLCSAGDTVRATADRLCKSLRATVFARLSGGARLPVLNQRTVEMPPGLGKVFDGRRHQIRDACTANVADGIGRGERRPVDALAALATLGIASWAWWYSPGGRKGPDELADVLVDMGMNGLAAAGPANAAATFKAALLAGIRKRHAGLGEL